MEKTPTCPKKYILRKTKCKCVKINETKKVKKSPKIKVIKIQKKEKKKEKKKECPPGSQMNKKTNRCNKIKEEKNKNKN